MKPKDKRDKHLLDNFADPDPEGELSDKDARKMRALWKKTRHKRDRAEDKKRLREYI